MTRIFTDLQGQNIRDPGPNGSEIGVPAPDGLEIRIKKQE